jgi:hypothetical protein
VPSCWSVAFLLFPVVVVGLCVGDGRERQRGREAVCFRFSMGGGWWRREVSSFAYCVPKVQCTRGS